MITSGSYANARADGTTFINLLLNLVEHRETLESVCDKFGCRYIYDSLSIQRGSMPVAYVHAVTRGPDLVMIELLDAMECQSFVSLIINTDTSVKEFDELMVAVFALLMHTIHRIDKDAFKEMK